MSQILHVIRGWLRTVRYRYCRLTEFTPISLQTPKLNDPTPARAKMVPHPRAFRPTDAPLSIWSDSAFTRTPWRNKPEQNVNFTLLLSHWLVLHWWCGVFLHCFTSFLEIMTDVPWFGLSQWLCFDHIWNRQIHKLIYTMMSYCTSYMNLFHAYVTDTILQCHMQYIKYT